MIVTPPQFVLKLWNSNRMPDNIRRHSIVVGSLAYDFAIRLQHTGEDVDPELTRDGGLVHDIGKIEGVETDREEEHHVIAQNILVDAGYPRLGHIAYSHMLEGIIKPDMWCAWEEKLVNYADKLVTHDRVDTLKNRFEDLKTRYPFVKDLLEDMFPLYNEFEKDLFQKISITFIDPKDYEL